MPPYVSAFAISNAAVTATFLSIALRRLLLFFQKIVNFAYFLRADDLSSKLIRITVFESHQKCLRVHDKKKIVK